MAKGTSGKHGRRQSVIDRVLECTLAELAESGYAGVTLAGVAERAGVAKTTVWRRWPTREDLVRCAFEAHLNAMVNQDLDGSLHDTLVAFLFNMATYFSSDLGRGLFVAVVSTPLSEGLHEVLREIRDHNESIPWQVVNRAMDRGELPPNVDVVLAFDMLGGAIKHRILHGEHPIDKTYIRRLVEAVLAGVSDLARREKA